MERLNEEDYSKRVIRIPFDTVEKIKELRIKYNCSFNMAIVYSVEETYNMKGINNNGIHKKSDS